MLPEVRGNCVEIAKMRLVSSPESVRNGSPSLLAMVETIAATSVSLWLAWRQGSVGHIVIASAIAPFLLLRTRLSTWYTIRVLQKINDSDNSTIFSIFGMLLIPLIKLICSIRVVIRRPIYSISRIPFNYYQYVFVIDLHTSPQIIPGGEEIKGWDKSINSKLDAYSLLKGFVTFVVQVVGFRMPKFLFGIPFMLIYLIISIPLIVVSLSFRFAIKSTAIVWMPLLWVIYQSRPGTSVIDRIELNIEQPWIKLVRIYAVLVICGFVLKIGLIFGMWRFMRLDSHGPLGDLSTRLVAPFDLPLWQAASAINAVLTWSFFFRAKRHLLAKHLAEAWPEAWIKREYVAFQAVRTTLSLYAIACVFYIMTVTAWQTEWPPIHFILFPWTTSRGL